MICRQGNLRGMWWCVQLTQLPSTTCFPLPLEGYGRKYLGGIFMPVCAYACACAREREKESSHPTTLLNK